MVGLLPILSLIYVLRLVQWHLLRKQYPILGAENAGEHAALAKQFRSSRGRLWFAVLLWPVVIVAVLVVGIIYAP